MKRILLLFSILFIAGCNQAGTTANTQYATVESSNTANAATAPISAPLRPADTQNQALAVQQPVAVAQVQTQRVSATPPPAPPPPELRNPGSIYLSDNFDDVLQRTGRPDYIQYIGNKAIVTYKAQEFTMYQGGECKIHFDKRLVQKCEGCNLQKFPCSQ